MFQTIVLHRLEIENDLFPLAKIGFSPRSASITDMIEGPEWLKGSLKWDGYSD